MPWAIFGDILSIWGIIPGSPPCVQSVTKHTTSWWCLSCWRDGERYLSKGMSDLSSPWDFKRNSIKMYQIWLTLWPCLTERRHHVTTKPLYKHLVQWSRWPYPFFIECRQAEEKRWSTRMGELASLGAPNKDGVQRLELCRCCCM